MKKRICLSLIFALLLTLLAPGITFARQGDSGYEGGISSGEAPNKITYQYQEPCFLSGTPVVLSGTLLIKKALKEDAKTKIQELTTTYTYTLKNGAANTMTRNLVFVTTITLDDNGQKTESTQLKTARETLKVDGITYNIANITDYELSKSILNDIKPAVNYYAGELWSRKTYRIGTGTTNSDTTVVESTGKYYGYDEYWSSAEAQLMTQTISQCKPGKDPVIIGTVDIDISTTTKKQLKYYENQPNKISFEGGYVQVQQNENVLKYTAKMNELDKNKAPTGKNVISTKSLKMESFPTQTRLISPNLKNIKGHPSQESISLLFGLKAFKDTTNFDPQEYMSRAEFIDAFVKVAKEVPVDPALKAKKPKRSTKTVTPQSLFTDISSNHVFFTSINEAATRGIVTGNGKSQFRPDALITVAEAVTMMINSMGLNGLAPNPAAVTSFKDNDTIPAFARPSLYVAEKIDLIQEDSKGYIHPNTKVTKAKAADMMKAYIDFMSAGIRTEYMDKILSY
jgi:N-acetylmuramoyl-L-alanine amidase